MLQISYLSENGESLGIYIVLKSLKLTVFEAKTGLQIQLWHPNVQTFFQMVFYSGEMKGQKIFCNIDMVAF